MDVLRRWQVATAATAVAGLGLGAMAVGHQPTQDVPTIELTPSPTATTPRVVPEEPGGDDDAEAGGDGTEIVPPDVRSLEASVSSPAEASPDPPPAPVDDSPDSLDDPDSVDDPDSLESS